MINGFVIIDKPEGITSHDVVSRVRRIAGTRRVGHTGTLDPFATGVLPIAVNDGTKAIPFLDEGIKCYQALMQLGVVTDTLDMTGHVLSEREYSGITSQKVLQVFSEFTGSISQIPPMYSAIKQGGQPLYKLARQGQEVERAARQIHVFSIELLEYSPPFVSVLVTCSRGTYIRSLADDIGAKLGCGACLKELRRTASGTFLIKNAISLEKFESMLKEGRGSECLTSPYASLDHLADIRLNDTGLAKVMHGRSPDLNDYDSELPPSGETPVLVRLSHAHELVAVAEFSSGKRKQPQIALKRVFRTE